MQQSRNAVLVIRSCVVVLAVCVAILLVYRPWPKSGKPFSPAAEAVRDNGGDPNAVSLTAITSPVLSKSFIEVLQTHGAATNHVIECLNASLRGDFAGLELVVKRFGGGFRSTEAEYEPMRRALRAWSIANRPPFAREWSQAEWERWIDGASRTDLLSLPQDPTYAPVRSVNAKSVSATVVPEFNAHSLRDLDETLRELAKREGITVPADSRMIQAMGRFVYTDRDDATPRNPEMLVVTLRGRSLDERDFVAAYLFARRGEGDWFPFRVAAFSSSANETSENRAPPFIPAF